MVVQASGGGAVALDHLTNLNVKVSLPVPLVEFFLQDWLLRIVQEREGDLIFPGAPDEASRPTKAAGKGNPGYNRTHPR